MMKEEVGSVSGMLKSRQCIIGDEMRNEGGAMGP